MRRVKLACTVECTCTKQAARSDIKTASASAAGVIQVYSRVHVECSATDSGSEPSCTDKQITCGRQRYQSAITIAVLSDGNID